MGGEKIEVKNGKLSVPDNPIIPFIEGDGTGPDIMRASMLVWNSAIQKAYKGKRKIVWKEIYAGEKAQEKFGTPMPQETINTIREYIVAIKGPLTTPISGGYRSLNVTLRKTMELYACIRPVRWIKGVPAPMKSPELLDVIIFRENTEDVYAGIEYKEGTEDCKKLRNFLKEKFNVNIREGSGIGIKPISRFSTQRLMRKALGYAIKNHRKNITIVHKGNIMKFTEGAFKDWAYEVAIKEFRDYIITEDELWDQTKGPDGITPIKKPGLFASLRNGKEPGNPGGRIIIKDRIADQTFQQLLLRPNEYDILVTPNLNGDYISDACAAQVGGLGIAPGANIGDYIALFEATHGSAPKYRGMDKVNPSSLMLSGVMLFDYIGWKEAGELIEDALEKTILDKKVTYDLARNLDGVSPIKTSEFAEEIVKRMNYEG